MLIGCTQGMILLMALFVSVLWILFFGGDYYCDLFKLSVSQTLSLHEHGFVPCHAGSSYFISV
ncbi:hypothetical protein A0J61_10481 [Choanephora cucurbitarum]|uniref:Uncharacterized protein n=1 Tax=Choanephora cucurbitarum TaxID=101091 RepID=A0A1C7MYJ5_9FUNG|nr:hypothetical protein A0J61_10481 [Choanephora cucurbitarum]